MEDLTFYPHLGGPAIWTCLPHPYTDATFPLIGLWTPYPQTLMQATLDDVSHLLANEWESFANEEDPDNIDVLLPLSGQLRESRRVEPSSTSTVTELWASSADIRRVRGTPVTLLFTAPVDRVPQPVPEPVISTMPPVTFLVAQVLPPPQFGMAALVSGHERGAKGWWPYVVEQLDPEMQAKQQQLGDALRTLAGGDLGWVPVTGHIETVANGAYESARAQLHTSLLSTRDSATRAHLSKESAALDAARDQFRAMVGAHHALTREQWLTRWQEVRQMAQQLAAAYWHLHQGAQRGTLRPPSTPVMPPLTAKHLTLLPSANHFRALVQSFGPGLRVQSSLWNDTRKPLRLQTPNGSTILVGGSGPEADANVVLYRYVMDRLGPEGLKHLLIVLDTYDVQTSGKGQMVNARLNLAQALLRMGYPGQKAYDRDEQAKLLGTMFYLRNSGIESSVSPWAADEEVEEAAARRDRRRGGKRGKGARVWWTPLLVFEGIQYERDQDGNVLSLIVPTEVEYHLGKEYYNLLYGARGRQFFAVPTLHLLMYHAKNEQQELVIGFYLCNMLNMNGGRFTVSFRTLLEQSALRTAETLNRGNDRTRDAVRAIYALERLEGDGFYTRAAQPDIDSMLATDLATGACSPGKLAPATLERIRGNRYYARLHEVDPALLREKRRTALQRLLFPGKGSPTLTFLAGHLLIEQAAKRERQRQAAEARDEAARAARGTRLAFAQVIGATQNQRADTPHTTPMLRGRGRPRKGGNGR